MLDAANVAKTGLEARLAELESVREREQTESRGKIVALEAERNSMQKLAEELQFR